MRTAGVNARAGCLYLAVVEPTGDQSAPWRKVEVPTRLVPSAGLDEAPRLVDLRNRLRQDLRSAQVSAVGSVATRKYNNWKYRDAQDRVTLLAAVMFCCVELDIPYFEVKTEDIARTVHAPAHQLNKLESAKVGFSAPPLYWTTGLAEAYGAAAALQQRVEGGNI
jgi:hypothetical protein